MMLTIQKYEDPKDQGISQINSIIRMITAL